MDHSGLGCSIQLLNRFSYGRGGLVLFPGRDCRSGNSDLSPGPGADRPIPLPAFLILPDPFLR
jgi:hypothetical protein